MALFSGRRPKYTVKYSPPDSGLIEGKPTGSSTPSSSTATFSTSTSTFKIVLLGDSLINLPYSNFHLAEKIQSFFPNTVFEFVNAGINGNHISHIQQRLQTDVLDLNPDGVILFWDSDISSQSVETLMLKETQDQYELTVREVVAALQTKMRWVAVAGPGLLGEPGSLFTVERYAGKDVPLDRYREINRLVANDLKVDYIDMREAFMKAIPFYWPFQRWCVTTDGEHPNDYGTQIEAEKFAEVINQWLTKIAAAKK